MTSKGADRILKKIWNNPIFIWFILPLSQIITGIVLGAKENTFLFYPFLLLYLFLLFSHLIERILMKKENEFQQAIIPFRTVVMILIGVLLFLISIAVNMPAVLLLILYLFYIITLAYQRLQLERSIYFLILQIFIKVFILNIVAFYTQANFLNYSFIVYLIPIVFLQSMLFVFFQRKIFKKYNADNTYQIFMKKNAIHIIIALYALAFISIIILLYQNQISWIGWLIFFVSQFALLLPLTSRSFRNTMKTENYLSFFTSFSSIVYILMLLF